MTTHTSTFIPLKTYSKLARGNISTATALAALCGYALHGNIYTAEGFKTAAAVSWGCFLLTAGLSALNQWQEQETDARMQRTMHRPLASGIMNRQEALLFSMALICGALLWALLTCNVLTAAVFCAAFILYNFVYTPLKYVTSLALPIGNIAGSLPPIAGWTAAGGSPIDLTIIAVAAVFFLWQGPHAIRHAQAYRDDFNNTQLRLLPLQLPRKRVDFICTIWIASLATAIFFCAVFLPDIVFTARIFLAALALFIPATGFITKPVTAFHLLNLALILFLFITTSGRIAGNGF